MVDYKLGPLLADPAASLLLLMQRIVLFLRDGMPPELLLALALYVLFPPLFPAGLTTISDTLFPMDHATSWALLLAERRLRLL